MVVVLYHVDIDVVFTSDDGRTIAIAAILRRAITTGGRLMLMPRTFCRRRCGRHHIRLRFIGDAVVTSPGVVVFDMDGVGSVVICGNVGGGICSGPPISICSVTM
jgi:hypothetical protein